MGALDQVVGRGLCGQASLAGAEVDCLGVVGDQCERRLLRFRRVAVGDRQADLLQSEQSVDLQVLALLGYRGIAQEYRRP